MRNLTIGIYRFIRLTARGTRRSSAFLAPPRKGRGNGTGSRGVEFYLFSRGFTTSPVSTRTTLPSSRVMVHHLVRSCLGDSAEGIRTSFPLMTSSFTPERDDLLLSGFLPCPRPANPFCRLFSISCSLSMSEEAILAETIASPMSSSPMYFTPPIGISTR